MGEFYRSITHRRVSESPTGFLISTCSMQCQVCLYFVYPERRHCLFLASAFSPAMARSSMMTMFFSSFSSGELGWPLIMASAVRRVRLQTLCPQGCNKFLWDSSCLFSTHMCIAYLDDISRLMTASPVSPWFLRESNYSSTEPRWQNAVYPPLRLFAHELNIQHENETINYAFR